MSNPDTRLMERSGTPQDPPVEVRHAHQVLLILDAGSAGPTEQALQAAMDPQPIDRVVLRLSDHLTRRGRVHRWLSSWMLPGAELRRLGQATEALLHAFRLARPNDGRPVHVYIGGDAPAVVYAHVGLALRASEVRRRTLLMHEACAGKVWRAELPARLSALETGEGDGWAQVTTHDVHKDSGGAVCVAARSSGLFAQFWLLRHLSSQGAPPATVVELNSFVPLTGLSPDMEVHHAQTVNRCLQGLFVRLTDRHPPLLQDPVTLFLDGPSYVGFLAGAALQAAGVQELSLAAPRLVGWRAAWALRADPGGAPWRVVDDGAAAPSPDLPAAGTGWLDQRSLTPRGVRTAAGVAVALAAALPWGATGLHLFDLETPEVDASAQPAARPELVWLPGGTFQMGSPEGEAGRSTNEDQHTVEVGPFAMCRTEVTQGQWEAVMGSNPSDCDYGCGVDLPVQNVSWLDAVEFLNRLSTRDGLSSCYAVSGEEVSWSQGCDGYRLPTEAEWEYAARGGTQTAWSWGDEASGADAHAWYGPNADSKVHAVGTKAANPWGLHDVHGNVWEWVWDWYDEAYVDTVVDKGGPAQGRNRVLRGGSFGGAPSNLRSAFRYWLGPASRGGFSGLRCARGPRPSIEP